MFDEHDPTIISEPNYLVHPSTKNWIILIIAIILCGSILSYAYTYPVNPDSIPPAPPRPGKLTSVNLDLLICADEISIHSSMVTYTGSDEYLLKQVYQYVDNYGGIYGTYHQPRSTLTYSTFVPKHSIKYIQILDMDTLDDK